MSRLILAMIAIIALVVAGLAMSGVLSVRNDKEQTGITIDKKELKEKTREAVKKTEEAGDKAIDKTSNALHKAADQLRGWSHDSKMPAPVNGSGNVP